jgi:hypothetical protein
MPADDPALLQQGKADIALCHGDLDAGSANETARTCIAQRGYALGHESIESGEKEQQTVGGSTLL